MGVGSTIFYTIIAIIGVSLPCCCLYCLCYYLLRLCCPRDNIHHPAPPPAQSDDVIPTIWETYQMAPLPPSCPSAAYPDRTRAAVPSRATDGYQLEPKAGPPPDVGGNSNDEPPSYANLFPEN